MHQKDQTWYSSDFFFKIEEITNVQEHTKDIENITSYALKKVTSKITAQCADKNNAYSLCCTFIVFYCKFQAHVHEKLQKNVKKNASHMHEIYSKTL